jgi:Uma2 family endonuclease
MSMAVIANQQTGQLLDADEFLTSAPEGKLEFVRGKVIDMSPVNRRHHRLSMWLAAAFQVLAESINAEVFHESFLIRGVDSQVLRCPDIMVVLAENLGRIQPTTLEGPADLIVEIVSPDSVGRDRGDKFVEYEALGVSEYWIIDPERQVAEFYQLESGRYKLIRCDAGRYRSLVLPQVVVDPSWFWQEKLPETLRVLREWNVPL